MINGSIWTISILFSPTFQPVSRLYLTKLDSMSKKVHKAHTIDIPDWVDELRILWAQRDGYCLQCES
jgi:hypothetical protein